MNDAVLTGVETRTSLPIRIKRDESFQSLNTIGILSAGEGAGYAEGFCRRGLMEFVLLRRWQGRSLGCEQLKR